VKQSHKIIVTLAGVAVILIAAMGAWGLYKTQFWRGPDVQFGDQHLKTTVALVELHKVRYGRYPAQLTDLKFTGAWDPIASTNVMYRTNEAGTRYCVEVQRGWVGKPKLVMPPEFWQGTGYDPSLCR
jgi:hypothetical protein